MATLPKIKKEIRTVKLSELTPYPGNPRHNNKSAKMVAKSIQEYGYINPIVVDENLVVLAGNTRLKALKILQIEEADVLVVSGLSEAQAAGFVIADNRIGEYSKWNMAGLTRMVDGKEVNSEFLEEIGIRSVDKMKEELEELINS
jgi:chromosome partitioning protein parB